MAVPAATRHLTPPDRSRLLAAGVLRFSPLALAAVLALALTGVIQTIAYLGSLQDLVDTGFGRAVSIKAALLVALAGLGAVNRRRLLPALKELARHGKGPGRPGALLRRTIGAEVALVALALAVTAALVSYAPPSQAEVGPVSGSAMLGPALLEYTVDPAEVGRNELHLYLFDAEDGSQFGEAREVAVDLALPEREIGPLEAELRHAGPGHYVAPSAPFGVAGEWTVEVRMRISRFDQDEAEFEVPIQ